MRKNCISEIRAGLADFFEQHRLVDVSVSKFFLETTDTHIFDIVGESPGKDKVKCEKIWEIKADENNRFTVAETKLFWGGDLTEHEAFFVEEYFLDPVAANVQYAKAVRRMQDEAAEERRTAPPPYDASYSPRSFVILDKRADGVPLVKRISMGCVYYHDEDTIGATVSDDIGLFDLTFDQKNYGAWDFNSMATRPSSYFSTIEWAKVHIKADGFYEGYGGERTPFHLDEVYQDYGALLAAFHYFDEDFVKSDLKRKWQVLAGMDIDAMDELASFLAMEAYFAYGFIGIEGEAPEPLKRENRETEITYLNRLESYEDFIRVLEARLQGLEEGAVRDAYACLKERGDEKPLDIVHRFVTPHFNGGYETGKVYLAEVLVESLSRESAKKDALVRLADEASHYKFMGRILYGEHALKNAEYYHGCHYSGAFLAQYLGVYAWSGTGETIAYLENNTYECEGELRLHGAEQDVIPVRIVDFKENGMPIVEHVQEWHF